MNFCNIKENLLAYRAETGGHPLGLDRVFGFALIRAWVYLMFVGAAASFMTWSGEAIRPAFFLVSAGALCIALFGSALTGDRFVKLMLHPTARAAGPTLTGVGTVLLASSGAEGMIGDVCGIIGAITTGLGSGIIDLGYGELYRNEPPGRTTFEVPLAFFLAAVAYSLTAMLPPVTSCVLCALLPVVSGWILFVQQHAWSRKRQPTVRPIEFDLKSFAWRIGLCACLVGIADGMVRAAFLSSNNLSIHLLLQWPLAGAGLITMLIVYGAALLGSEQSTRTIYKAAIVVMAFFFMLLPIFTGAQDIESVLALTGYGTFNVLIWMLLAEISANYRLSSTRVFGIGWGMVTLGVLLGASIGLLTGSIMDANDADDNSSLILYGSQALGEGKTAIVALVQESDEKAFDLRLADYRCTITRWDAGEIADEAEQAEEQQKQLAKEAREKLRAQKKADREKERAEKRAAIHQKFEDFKARL